MKTEIFVSHSPYQIGDKIKVVMRAAGSAAELYLARTAEITDIVMVNYLKDGSTEFAYELDHSGYFQRL